MSDTDDLWRETKKLRDQLVQLGRTLKAEEFYHGYSDMREDDEIHLEEMKANLKSEIGRAILDALGEER